MYLWARRMVLNHSLTLQYKTCIFESACKCTEQCGESFNTITKFCQYNCLCVTHWCRCRILVCWTLTTIQHVT